MICSCHVEYGPCEDHSITLFQRDGAAARTDVELELQFIEDARALDPDCLSATGKADLEQVLAALAKDDVLDDPDLYQSLTELVDQVESYISGTHRTATRMVYRDDGYRIVDITGGPLLED